jgi:Fe-S-cluster containining protein
MSIASKLAEIYARVPHIACKGLCFECCGPIHAHKEEVKRMERLAGKELNFDGETGRCSLLNEENRCSAYRDRPLVCRLWGVTEKMPCIYGCEPDRMLTNMEGVELMALLIRDLGYQMVASMPTGEWAEFALRHRRHLHRTLQYGPVHAPWPEEEK